MLSLDSPRWDTLRQAYGSAADVPRLIAALASLPDDDARAELWFALWRMLWRPDAVHDAAYAAVPHLLSLVATRPLGERVQAIHLAVRVELARCEAGSGSGGHSMPADLVAAYAAAIDALPLAVMNCADASWNAEIARILAAALLVGKRQPELAAELLALASE